MFKESTRWGLLAAFTLALGIAAGVLVLKPHTQEIRSGTLLRPPRAVIDFELVDSGGQPFRKADLSGHWTLIFPGFTFCPDVCPTTLSLLKAVYGKLGKDAGKLQVVFLSVDPERDTPDKLGAYVHAFSKDFVGVTGSTAELDRLGMNLDYVYTRIPGATPETYTVDHSVEMILIGPDASLRGFFTSPYRVDALVADLRALIAGRARAS